MLPNPFRILLIATAFCASLAFAITTQDYARAAVFFAIGLMLLFSYFRYGHVWFLFKSVSNGKFEKAERLLYQIHKPEWLAVKHRAYYYLSKGFINLSKGNKEVAISDMKVAIDLGLRTANDSAVAHLYIASMYKDLGDRDNASQYIKVLKDIPHDGHLNDEMTDLKKEIAKM